MANRALPKASQNMLAQNMNKCRNLGLILDKFAPWGEYQGRQWNLIARVKPSNKRKDASQQTGGQAKGHWLKHDQTIYSDESPSVFIDNNNQEIPRTDTELMQQKQARWQQMVKDNNGIAFQMRLVERMAAGLGASHVLETGLTLERNTGLPCLPGSTVKGLARAWGLIQVADSIGIRLTDNSREMNPLGRLATMLIEEEQPGLDNSIRDLLNELPDTGSISEEAGTYVDYFRFIFGSQISAGAICFTDGIYFGRNEPRYATDVMTPHYVQYYTGQGDAPPADDDNPNPVSFLTVDSGNLFAFGLLPRQSAFENLALPAEDILAVARDWLIKALSSLGAGSKTAAGYGFFSQRSADMIVE
jgi:CRISPR-associated protein Cmr6